MGPVSVRRRGSGVGVGSFCLPHSTLPPQLLQLPVRKEMA